MRSLAIIITHNLTDLNMQVFNFLYKMPSHSNHAAVYVCMIHREGAINPAFSLWIQSCPFSRFDKVILSLRFDKVIHSLRFGKATHSLRFDKAIYSLRFGKATHSLRFDKAIYSLRFGKATHSLRFDKAIYSLRFGKATHSLRFDKAIYSLRFDKVIHSLRFDKAIYSSLLAICLSFQSYNPINISHLSCWRFRLHPHLWHLPSACLGQENLHRQYTASSYWHLLQ